MKVEKFVEAIIGVPKNYKGLLPKWVKDFYKIEIKRNNKSIYPHELVKLGDYEFELTISGFSFNQEVIIHGNRLYWGCRDTDKLVCNLDTSEVYLIDGLNEGLLYILSNEYTIFLEILVEIAQYEFKGYLGKSYNQSDRDEILNFCLLRLPSQCHKFYEDSYGHLE